VNTTKSPNTESQKSHSHRKIAVPRFALKVLSIAVAGLALGLLPDANLTWGCSHAEFAIIAPEAEAQNFGQRVIQGKVLDDREQPISGATVFLENVKSRDVKSYDTPQSGSFRFTQVGMIDDYQVWAEKGKKKSSVRTISSFDSRKEVDVDFHLK
jgi:uncharacterized GH25 family protein